MNDNAAQLLITLLSAGGGGAFLTALVTGLIKLMSGASHRERIRNTNLAAQRTRAIEERDKAEKERDEEADERRETEEYVSMLKRQLIEIGVRPVDRPERKL